SDTTSFLKKIDEHLSQTGQLIITVPFGINDYFDHKRTYYFSNIYEHMNEFFRISKIEYIGNWMGVVCYKKSEGESDDISVWDELRKMEAAFYQVEYEYLSKVKLLQRSNAE